MTPLSRLPAFFVFPQQQLHVPAAAATLAACSLLAEAEAEAAGDGGGSSSGQASVLVFLDQPLLHQLGALQQALAAALQAAGRAGAAARLVFPAVPRQHMEPQQPAAPQQQQQHKQQGQAAGCCGAGVCGPAPTPQQEQQQRQVAPGCCGGGACAAPPPPPQQQQQQQPASGAGPEPASAAAENGSSAGSTRHQLAGYEWQLPAGVETGDCGLVWVGAPDAPALVHLQLTYSTCRWAMLDASLLPPPPAAPASDGPPAAADGTAAAAAAAVPAALSEGLPLDISRALRRRYFLVEKARDASIVGILVGTLGAAGYADAVARLRRAAAGAGKKSYTLLVGKPSPAKLANFPEVEVGGWAWGRALAGAGAARRAGGARPGIPAALARSGHCIRALFQACCSSPRCLCLPCPPAHPPVLQVFVLVADPQGQILDCKDYLAPIITPHEALLAWAPDEVPGGGAWEPGRYRLDFDEVLAAPGLGQVRWALGS